MLNSNEANIGEYNPLVIYEAPFIYNIGENAFVTTQRFWGSNKEYYDVVLHLKDKKLLLGRFPLELSDLRIAYKDGRILIYYDEYNHEKGTLEIIKVLGLYDIADDVFISSKEKEALVMFDPDLNTEGLKNPSKYIYRSDPEKKLQYVKYINQLKKSS